MRTKSAEYNAGKQTRFFWAGIPSLADRDCIVLIALARLVDGRPSGYQAVFRGLLEDKLFEIV